jgi:hypothetical protein
MVYIMVFTIWYIPYGVFRVQDPLGRDTPGVALVVWP